MQTSVRRNRKLASEEHAKRLRREMTHAEKRLWSRLRAHRFNGWKFRRQQVIGPYVADFLCAAANLIVEADGVSHVGRTEEDEERQKWLEGKGYMVLRFWDSVIFKDIRGVLETVWAACERRVVNSHAPLPDQRRSASGFDRPSPSRGEGRG